MPKFLIIRFSSIGDIVLTSPILRCVKEQLNAEVHFLTKKVYRSLVEGNPYIDHVHTIQKNLREVVPALQAERFDGIVDLHKNLRTWQVRLALRKPTGTFPKLNFQKWLLVRWGINRLPETHIVDRYFRAVRKWGVESDGQGLDYFIPESRLDAIDQQIADLGIGAGPYIALAIGAAHATKRLPEHKLQELCQSLDGPIVLLGGPAEADLGIRLKEQAGKQVINTCGKLSLHGSARLIERAALVISHDTGMMHIAAAFKRPIISIWGSTIPAFGMTPYYPKGIDLNTSLEVQGLACRPCSKIGFSECPKGHFDCMQQQQLERVPEVLQKRLHT